jgi:hypothetical protein
LTSGAHAPLQSPILRVGFFGALAVVESGAGGERSFGSFQRSLVLPEGTDINNVRASFENGVLEVIAPLPDRAQQRGSSGPYQPENERD